MKRKQHLFKQADIDRIIVNLILDGQVERLDLLARVVILSGYGSDVRKLFAQIQAVRGLVGLLASVFVAKRFKIILNAVLTIIKIIQDAILAKRLDIPRWLILGTPESSVISESMQILGALLAIAGGVIGAVRTILRLDNVWLDELVSKMNEVEVR